MPRRTGPGAGDPWVGRLSRRGENSVRRARLQALPRGVPAWPELSRTIPLLGPRATTRTRPHARLPSATLAGACATVQRGDRGFPSTGMRCSRPAATKRPRKSKGAASRRRATCAATGEPTRPAPPPLVGKSLGSALLGRSELGAGRTQLLRRIGARPSSVARRQRNKSTPTPVPPRSRAFRGKLKPVHDLMRRSWARLGKGLHESPPPRPGL